MNIEKTSGLIDFIQLNKINVFIGLNNSGKSRLLRNIFINFQHLLDDNTAQLEKIQQRKFEIIQILNQIINTIIDKKEIADKFKECKYFFEQPTISYQYYNLIDFLELRKLHIEDKKQETTYHSLLDSLEVVYQLVIPIQPKTVNPSKSATYIPILRGLKPRSVIRNDEKLTLTLEEDHYKERVLADYFKNSKSVNLYTGLNIYFDIRSKLLGSEKDRTLIKEIENFLDLHVFNQSITLIPKINDDILHIKIGDEEDRRISDLGDGIQSILTILFPILLYKDEEHYFFIEEPETNLHPKKQVQILNLLSTKFPKHQFFITSHSAHFLKSDDLNIFKIENSTSKLKISKIENSREVISLLNDLGYSASDMLQTNYLIWVEGPSDVIYFEYFLKKLLPENYKLNTHYSILMYGGKNGVHLFKENKIENLMSINRNCSIIADSDKKSKTDKSIIEDDFKKLEGYGIHTWITPYREIENHINEDQFLNAIKKIQGFEKSEYAESGNYSDRFLVNTNVNSNDINKKLTMNDNLFKLAKKIDSLTEIEKIDILSELKKSIKLSSNIKNVTKKVDIAKHLILDDVRYDKYLSDLLLSLKDRIMKANSDL